MQDLHYSSAELFGAISGVRDVLAAVQQQLTTLIQQQGAQMASNLSVIQGKIDALTADVAAGKTVNESAITLINGLTAQNVSFKQQIQDLINASGTPAEFQKAVDDLDASNVAMDEARQKLADALTANTTPSA